MDEYAKKEEKTKVGGQPLCPVSTTACKYACFKVNRESGGCAVCADVPLLAQPRSAKTPPLNLEDFQGYSCVNQSQPACFGHFIVPLLPPLPVSCACSNIYFAPACSIFNS